MFKRAVLFVATLIAAILGLPPMAAAAIATPPPITHAYDSLPYDNPMGGTASERGPPGTTCDYDNTVTTVGRPDDAPPPNAGGAFGHTTYPSLGRLAQVATAMTVAPVQVGEGESAQRQRWGVAANTAPRMGATFGARDAATKNMTRWAERNPRPGYYDVIGHGSPNSLSGMSAAELAAKIGSTSGGQNIRLLSCQTGCPTGTFAQDLANRLGVRVMAPTTDIGASGSGKTLTVFDGGQWRWFDPNLS